MTPATRKTREMRRSYSLLSWRYCVGARLKFWRRSSDGSAVKSHSTVLQRLRRQISLDYYTIPPATEASGRKEKTSPQPPRVFRVTREFKQRRFWATHINRKWTFCTLELWFGTNFLGQVVSIRVMTLGHTNLVASRHVKKRKKLTSGRRTSLKNVAA